MLSKILPSNENPIDRVVRVVLGLARSRSSSWVHTRGGASSAWVRF
jgi:hypothetical protein